MTWRRQRPSLFLHERLRFNFPKCSCRTIIVRLISTAQTGFFYTTKRPRIGSSLSAVKYDPVVKRRVIFVESKKTRK
ncbi:hypothetical protein FISHEDRAFT_33237 [Fistulina hepatica ATCC 64428]|uniref:Large ribosomal subunit protein bL33m n=1 Tax=Fistulina hepatica ATCC 64428 TaxID=1128425 RepID=A0A0D7AQA0_9AGAR|nr:hypothetical protein FISHEDRAFT_33237 [Fistulina hepatica ATCC 64428]